MSRPQRQPRRWPLWLRLTAVGLTLVAATAGGLAWNRAQREPAADAPRVQFTVDNLDCPVWCAVRLSEAIDALDGARVESIDRAHGTVTIRHDPKRQPRGTLQALIERRGFPVRSARPLPAR